MNKETCYSRPEELFFFIYTRFIRILSVVHIGCISRERKERRVVTLLSDAARYNAYKLGATTRTCTVIIIVTLITCGRYAYLYVLLILLRDRLKTKSSRTVRSATNTERLLFDLYVVALR